MWGLQTNTHTKLNAWVNIQLNMYDSTVVHGWLTVCDPDYGLVQSCSSPLCVSMEGDSSTGRCQQRIYTSAILRCGSLMLHCAALHLLIYFCCQGNLYCRQLPFHARKQSDCRFKPSVRLQKKLFLWVMLKRLIHKDRTAWQNQKSPESLICESPSVKPFFGWCYRNRPRTHLVLYCCRAQRLWSIMTSG